MSRDKEGTVEFDDCKVIKQTAAAILVEIEGKQYWLPQSQVHANSEIWKEGDEGKLVLTEWIALQKGLI